MTKDLRWKIGLVVGLIAVSFVLYYAHYLFFGDLHHILIYLLGDVAFLPIEVLLVTIIIHRLLTKREKRQMLSKLNMVIGAFFSEVGTRLLGTLVCYDSDREQLEQHLCVSAHWGPRDFAEARRFVKNYKGTVRVSPADLVELRTFLSAR